jgi:hypothetical protein
MSKKHLETEAETDLRHQRQNKINLLNGEGQQRDNRQLPEGFKAENGAHAEDIKITPPSAVRSNNPLMADARDHLLDNINGVSYDRQQKSVTINLKEAEEHSLDQLVTTLGAIAERANPKHKLKDRTEWIQETQEKLGMDILDTERALTDNTKVTLSR